MKDTWTHGQENCPVCKSDSDASNAGQVSEASKKVDATPSPWTPWSLLSGILSGTPMKRRRTAHSAYGISEEAVKKAKTCLIDDQVALQIFLDLGLNDRFLNSGKVLAWALQPDEPAYINICDYVAQGQSCAVWKVGIKVISILRIVPRADTRERDNAPFDFSEDPRAIGKKRMMLWHGTAMTNVRSILENGLKLPPTSYDEYFGGGIYFSDMVANSSDYCKSVGDCYMFLCDVLVGDIFKPGKYLPGIQMPPRGYDSVKGCGEYERSNREIDGCVWPLGSSVRNVTTKYLDAFSEYVVYNTNQVHPKYLVKMELSDRPVFEKLY